jgi:hypothetical protein
VERTTNTGMSDLPDLARIGLMYRAIWLIVRLTSEKKGVGA